MTLLRRLRAATQPPAALPNDSSVTLQQGEALYVTPEGKTLALPLTEVWQHAVPAAISTSGLVLPGCVRLAYSAGSWTVLVCEFAPEVRQLKWITADSPAPFGPEARYRDVRIALPYVIVMAVYQQGTLTAANEAFFRVGPLESEDDPLAYPALLNCSRYLPPDDRPLSWICTQKLERGPIEKEKNPARRMRIGLQQLLRCLYETGFNYSSDVHEYSSWYSESKGVDPRLATVEAWEEASARDPLFVLDVPFLPVGLSVVQVVERIFRNGGARRPASTAAEVAAWIVNHGKPR